VFDVLIESRKKGEGKKALGVGAISLMLHTVIIGGAVVATLTAGSGDASTKVDTQMVFLNQQQEQKQDQPPPPQLDMQLKGFQTVIAPTDIPTNIPPVNLQEHFDPRDYSGVGVEGGVATGIVPGADQVLSVDVVQEKPELLSHPPVVYPPLLQQAGIEGRVMVQAIVDTTGRVEVNSARVMESANPGFDQPAKNVVLKSLYRPGRVYGRAVRVLVQIPIDFKIQRNR
jgi:TonB family protein